MEALLDWARGPLFKAAVVFMVLGLLRHLVLSIAGIRSAVRRAGDRRVPHGALFVETIGWLIPFGKIRERVGYSLCSIVFHVGLIVTPLFLAGHVVLWQQGIGLVWPALPQLFADVLTLTTLGAAGCLVGGRLATAEARSLTRPIDIALLALIVALFGSGYLLTHPEHNPFGYTGVMLTHVLLGDAIMILIPTSKLSHCVLLPLTRYVAELGWRFPTDAGERVIAELGRENEPI